VFERECPGSPTDVTGSMVLFQDCFSSSRIESASLRFVADPVNGESDLDATRGEKIRRRSLRRIKRFKSKSSLKPPQTFSRKGGEQALYLGKSRKERKGGGKKASSD